MEQIYRALSPEALAKLKADDTAWRAARSREELRAVQRERTEDLVGNRKARRRAKALARASA